MGMENTRAIATSGDNVELLKAGIDPRTGNSINNGKGNVVDTNGDGIPDNVKTPFTSTITGDVYQEDNSYAAREKDLHSAHNEFKLNKTEYLMALVDNLDLGTSVETRLKEIANNKEMSAADHAFVNSIIEKNNNNDIIGLRQRKDAYLKSKNNLILSNSMYEVSKEELRNQMSTKTDKSLEPFGYKNEQEVFDAYINGKIQKNPNYGINI
jgi:hypothetical protein